MLRWILFATFFWTTWASAQPSAPATSGSGPVLRLTQKDAAQMALKQGFQAKEVNYKYEALSLKPIEALSVYDWTLTLTSGYEKDRTKSFTLYNNPDVQRYRSQFTLSKSLLTGTALTLDYSRVSQNYINPSSEAPITLDLATLSLEQSLWANFFGQADRATVRSAEVDYQASSLLRINELEDLVLDVLRQFWNTYVAQENFSEALASKDRYEKLVSVVKRKSSFGYSNPAELSQVQAEYETRIQTVKTTSSEYLRNLESLTLMLHASPGTEIQFSVPADLPPVPEIKPKHSDDKRAIQSQKLKVESAHEALVAARSKKQPTLNLVGILGGSGADDNSSRAFSEVGSGSYPKYYVGLKFQYKFGSDYPGQSEFNKRVSYELEQTRLQRQLLEENDKETQAERKVSTTFAVAQSTKAQKEYREKAVQELTRTYNQGRTDISVLIDAMNKYFSSQIQYARAIGDYQIALNEWAAIRDELIPSRPEEK